MPTRTAYAIWEGALKDGRGTVNLGSGAFEAPYSFASRFQDGAGTNPEELLGAADAGCFSMALAHKLAQAGYTPVRIQTAARVHLDNRPEGFRISRIDLETEAEVPGIEEHVFLEYAEDAKANCPISKALAAEITLRAQILGGVRAGHMF